MHLGLAEQLVLEVVGEVAVHRQTDETFHFEWTQLEVVLLKHHLEGHHRQLFQLVFRIVLAVVGRAGRNHVHRPLELGNTQVPRFERNHNVPPRRIANAHGGGAPQ
ncbi:MAG TPA: hypothetical protein VMH22_12465 [bacterium]|nr:hypothetical protein [bacterium]